MLRTVPPLAACAVALLVVAGCDADAPAPNYSSVTPAPSTSTASPTPSASTSPTDIPTTGPNSSPGELVPTLPDAANARSSAGALAFLSYYYRLSDWAFATSEARFLDSLYAPSCSACAEGQNNLESLFANGQYVTGGRITMQSVQLVANDARQGADFAVTGVFSVEAATLHAAGGAVKRTYPSNDRFQLTDWVKWVDDHWVIVDEGKA